MKKLVYLAVCLAMVLSVFPSCEDEETYAEQKEREKNQIMDFIARNNIKVIELDEFLKDTITDVNENEYVLFSDNGVYMQIVRRGGGRVLPAGEKWTINVRYVETFPQTGDTMSMNRLEINPDVFYVKRDGDNYSASFTSGIMASRYGYSVPNAWLMPLPYITPGFLNSRSAKVRMIVPHNQGTQRAASNVYPAFYEIDYTTEKWQ